MPTLSLPQRSTAPQRGRSIATATLMLAALVIAVPLSLTLPVPAFADEGSMGAGVTAGTITPTTPTQPPTTTPKPGEPSGGGSAGGGGSGGAVTPGTFSWLDEVWNPTQPPSPLGRDNYAGLLWSPGSKSYTYGGACNGWHRWSAGGKSHKARFLGTRYRLSGTYVGAYTDPADGFAVPPTYTATAGGYECVPPPEYIVSDWTCVIKGEANYTGPMKNGETPVKPSKFVPLPDKWSAFAKSGKTDWRKCDNPEQFGWNVNNLRDWGQYDLNATAYVQGCDFYHYYTINQQKNAWEDDYIVCPKSNANLTPVSHGTDKLEIFCSAPYEHKAHHGYHTFDARDCTSPNPNPTWECVTPNAAIFNGRTGNQFDVLDDGKERMLKWDRAQVIGAGVRKVKNETARLALGNTHSISPYRDGETANGTRQPYVVSPKVNAWANNWRQALPVTNKKYTGWEVAFMAPGVPSKPWTVKPTWAFDAQFLTYVPSSVSIDMETGRWTVTDSIPYWYKSSETCTSPEVELNVYRARNSQGR